MDDSSGSLILIVDDEHANIFFLDGVLTSEGFKTITASSGKECLDIIQTNIPDIILLDIMMPEMDGLEALSKILENEKTKDIPVVMVTAKTESDDVEKALSLGAVEYIKKPIDEIELLARVRTALRIKKQGDRLKEMLQVKNEFIKTISHDVRTPFTAITGLAQFLYNDPQLKKKLNNDQLESLKLIIDSSEYTFNYFNKLLNWSNLGSAELILEKNNIKLSKIVDNSQNIFQTRLEEKNISFIKEVDSLIELYVDETYFSQVINNLLNNAIKFTPQGGTIRIAASPDNGSTNIHISDTGVGIKDITPEELFSKQVNMSTIGTEGEKGTGIGLNICKKIIDAHGHSITFKSIPDNGTEFIITVK